MSYKYRGSCGKLAVMGRKKSKLDLPDGWQDVVLSAYKSGASDVEIKATIIGWRGSFSNDLWDRWLLEEPVFSETIKKGRMLSECWWNRLGQVGAVGLNKINPTVWIFNMKNRFGWSDRRAVEHSGPDGGPIEVTKVERTIVKPKHTDG